jgi:hypothetical protein
VNRRRFEQAAQVRSQTSDDRSSSIGHAKAAAAHAIELARQGTLRVTKLGLEVIAKVASYGPECFVVDRKLAEHITQNNGKHPHRGSVARVRRDLTRQGVFQAKRIYPAQQISRVAKRTSTHGCVRSRLNRKLGFRPVVPRPPEPEAAIARPRHTAPPAILQTTPALTGKEYLSEFEAMAARAIAASSRGGYIAHVDAREAADDARMYESVQRVRGPP